MDRKNLGIGIGLVLVGLGAAWWWLRGAPTPPPAKTAASEAPVERAPTPPAPPPVPTSESTPGGEPDPYDSQEPKPTLGLRPAHARQSFDTKQLSPEEMAKYGSTLKVYQDAWAKYVEPLLYPPGHPEAGTYREGVCLEQAVQAQVDYFGAVNPPGYMEQPRLHIQRRLRYEVVRDLAAGWDQDDLMSNRNLYEKLMAAPEDPTAMLTDLWLAADPNDRDATNRREFLEKRLRKRETPIFAKRGCPDAG